MTLMTPMQGTDSVVFRVNAVLQVERSCLRTFCNKSDLWYGTNESLTLDSAFIGIFLNQNLDTGRKSLIFQLKSPR